MTATAAETLAAARIVRVQATMKRQHMHADGALLPRWRLFKRANIQLFSEIELAPSFVKFSLNALALLLMLLAVLVLAFLVAIPNALATVALLKCVAFLSARRTQLGRGGPTFRGGFLPFRRFAE